MNIAADTDAQISVNRYTGMHRHTRNQIHVNVLSHMYSGQTHTCLETQLYTGRCPSEYTGTCLCEHILMNAYTNVCLETSQGNVLTGPAQYGNNQGLLAQALQTKSQAKDSRTLAP